jgi:Tfp pilus assembly protein PilN
MDWKREIKVSDLVPRRGKRSAVPAAAADETASGPAKPEARDAGGGRSFLKREISFRRRNWDPAESADTPRPAKRERRRKNARPLAEVPLMRAFNLLPSEDVRQTGRRPSSAQLVLAVTGLVIIAALGSLFLITNARVADKAREYQELRDRLAARAVPAEEPEMETGDAELVLERVSRTDALAAALGQRIAWDRILREFSLVLPEDVWLKSLKAASAPPPNAAPAEGAQPTDASATAKNTFEINGYARDQEAIAELLTRLAVVPEIETAQLVSATKVELQGESVLEFTMSAVVKPRQAGGNA